jgi:hypothetical protein
MRRDFILPEQDSDFLSATGLIWETMNDISGRWLIIQGYPVPIGYNIQSVNLALKVEPNYPVTQFDMVYFFPYLSRINGKVIGALAMQNIQGKMWQRWSRHRTAQNPWRVGLDDVSTHLQLVDYWLERELRK